MAKEKMTDDFVARLLMDAKIKYVRDDGITKDVKDALSGSSKRLTGKTGYPEFSALVGDFVLVVEDKAEIIKQAKYDNDGQTLIMDKDGIINYAENGALHYAQHIIEKSAHGKVFAFGCSGDERHYKIRPMFVSKGGYKLLAEVDNFQNFTAENIDRYYHEQVLGETPKEVHELQDILNRAKTLHEDLRNYGQLGDQEKPLVVSAILLALDDFKTPTKQQDFINTLTGDSVRTDGQKIYEAIDAHMKRVKVEPQVKLDKVMSQFNIIKNRDVLSVRNKHLGKTPLKHYAEYLKQYVLDYTKNNSPEDVLGRFYGEFMSYSGGDGQSLGVVLTPKHITELFCDLVNIQKEDVIFDPCCGTAGFLIAGMHRMIESAGKDTEQVNHIKHNQIFGVELRDDMFSIATTNMILRGDGQSNLISGDFLAESVEKWRTRNISVGFINPPYSMAKNAETKHLSEINFIEHLLDCAGDKARVVAIIPQSTMVGKTKEDKVVKVSILKNHTLEGVITLNKETFYRVGTNPCIAVFTAHVPHDSEKYVKFINFEDDGFEVQKHIGLVETERAKEKKAHLIACWHKGAPAETKFMVKSQITADDEWLHSFYYFNDEVPTDAEFEKTMADYLTFEFNMITHGRSYLFGAEE